MRFKKIIWVMMFIFLCSFAYSISTSDLISYHSFDINETNSTDDTGNQYWGNVTGAVWNNTETAIGSTGAFDFNRADLQDRMQLNLGWDEVTGENNNLTITMWVYYRSQSIDSALIYTKGSDTNNHFDHRTDLFYINQMGGGATNTYNIDTDEDKWYFVVLRKYGTEVEVLVNGTSLGTATTNAAPSVGEFVFGARGATFDEGHDGLLDEIAIWNTTLNSSELDELWNNGDGLNPLPATDLTITARDRFTLESLTTFNATINSIVYNTTTGTIETGIPLSNSTLLNISIGAQNYSEDYVSNFNASNTLLVNMTHYFYNNTDFESSVLELETVPFNFTINTTPAVTGTEVTLYYNNTLQTLTKTVNANYTLYTADVTTPTISVNTNVSVLWNWTVNSTKYGNRIGSLEKNQTVFTIGIDNCTTFTTQAINFTIVDDDTRLAIPNSTLEGFFEAFNVNGLTTLPFNLTWQPNPEANYAVCIQSPASQFQFSAQLEYDAINYTAKNYYFSNSTLDNSTEYIDLILTNGTTPTTITVTDQDDNTVEGLLVYVLSYDFATDTGVVSEIVQTDDNGVAIAQIVTTTKWYKFVLVYNGRTVLETNPQKVLTTSLNFRVNLLEDYFVDYNAALGVSCDVSYSNSTGVFTYTFNDPTGSVVEGCLIVNRLNVFSDDLINETCVTSSGGTIDISINNSESFEFTGFGNVVIGSDTFSCDNAFADLTSNWRTYGNAGLFPSLILAVTLPMLAIAFPPGAIMLMIVSFIVMNLIGIFHLSWPYLVSLIILGGITLFKVSNK